MLSSFIGMCLYTGDPTTISALKGYWFAYPHKAFSGLQGSGIGKWFGSCSQQPF
jgi:hypothetical protein